MIHTKHQTKYKNLHLYIGNPIGDDRSYEMQETTQLLETTLLQYFGDLLLTEEKHVYYIPRLPLFSTDGTKFINHIFLNMQEYCIDMYNILKEVDALDFYVIYDDSSEAFEPNSWYRWQPLAFWCMTHHIQPNNTWYMTAALPSDYTLNALHERLTRFKHRILCTNNWAFVVRTQIEHSQIVYKPGLKPYKILCYNNSNKAHRAIILGKCLLLKDKLSVAYSWREPLSDNYSKLHQYFPEELDAIYQIREPAYLDGFDNLTYLYMSQDEADLSMISLVNESSFFSDVELHGATEPSEFGQFLTEKTFKAINACHPFILVTKPHSLKELKRLGFKTFSEFWDESYDDVEDDIERLKCINALLEQLSTWSDSEWIKFSHRVKDIVIHNRDRLILFANEIYLNHKLIARRH